MADNMADSQNVIDSIAPWMQTKTQQHIARKDEESAEEKKGFQQPQKLIASQEDIHTWKKSQARADVLAFIFALNNAVKGKMLSEAREPSSTVSIVVKQLKQMQQWIEEIPPLQQPMRFGNKAFRIWHHKLLENAPAFHKALLPPALQEANSQEELIPYLADGFGSPVRIDYGTGHELNFVTWLCCLAKLNLFTPQDGLCLVFDVFATYLDLIRSLQKTYVLEPAGSKGVWGLDDFQFLPFFWGASQLIDHDSVVPSDIMNAQIVSENARDYLYMAAIQFIGEMKKGPFAEHSPLLHDISGVVSWSKVNSGLIRMYYDAVLDKFPVIQHFLFGSLLTMKQAPPQQKKKRRMPLPSQQQQQQQQDTQEK